MKWVALLLLSRRIPISGPCSGTGYPEGGFLGFLQNPPLPPAENSGIVPRFGQWLLPSKHFPIRFSQRTLLFFLSSRWLRGFRSSREWRHDTQWHRVTSSAALLWEQRISQDNTSLKNQRMKKYKIAWHWIVSIERHTWIIKIKNRPILLVHKHVNSVLTIWIISHTICSCDVVLRQLVLPAVPRPRTVLVRKVLITLVNTKCIRNQNSWFLFNSMCWIQIWP